MHFKFSITPFSGKAVLCHVVCFISRSGEGRLSNMSPATTSCLFLLNLCFFPFLKGMQLLHGGVDVLETIGRKTYTALKENDPGLSYTKQFLRPAERNQMPKLSQVSYIFNKKYQFYSYIITKRSSWELLQGNYRKQMEHLGWIRQSAVVGDLQKYVVPWSSLPFVIFRKAQIFRKPGMSSIFSFVIRRRSKNHSWWPSSSVWHICGSN